MVQNNQKPDTLYIIGRSWYTSDEVCSALNICGTTLRAWRNFRDFPDPIGPNQRVKRYRKNDVDRWVTEHYGNTIETIRGSFKLEINRAGLTAEEVLKVFDISPATLNNWQHRHSFPKSSGPTERRKIFKLDAVNEWCIKNFGDGIVMGERENVNNLSSLSISEPKVANEFSSSQKISPCYDNKPASPAPEDKNLSAAIYSNVLKNKINAIADQYGYRLNEKELKEVLVNLTRNKYSIEDLERCLKQAFSHSGPVDRQHAIFLSQLSKLSSETNEIESALEEFNNA